MFESAIFSLKSIYSLILGRRIYLCNKHMLNKNVRVVLIMRYFFSILDVPKVCGG